MQHAHMLILAKQPYYEVICDVHGVVAESADEALVEAVLNEHVWNPVCRNVSRRKVTPGSDVQTRASAEDESPVKNELVPLPREDEVYSEAVARMDAEEQQEAPTSLKLPGQFTSTGWIPPGDMVFEEWEEMGRSLKLAETAIQFWIGDWVRYGEQRWGEMYSQALDETGYSYKSLRNMAYVAGSVELSRRRDNLSWAHHADVAALTPDVQDVWLNKASVEGWSHRELRRQVGLATVEARPLPAGVFDIILADPPWQYDNAISSWGPADLHYTAMDTEDIMALKVPASGSAILFLWATNPLLEDALRVAQAWGFEYKTNAVWVKKKLKRPGSGFWLRGRHELLLICARPGARVPAREGLKPIGSVIEAPVREHSRKPDEAYEIIEALFPDGRYLELFARGAPRTGWTAWGAEATDGDGDTR